MLLCSILAFSCFCAFAFLCCRVFGFRVFASSRFRVFPFSRFRVFPFSQFRVFAFSRFRVFAFSSFSCFRVFVISRFRALCSILAFSCFCECISACCAKPFSCCNQNVRVQSATEWTASVHTSHMPKAVITFVFQVLRNGLLRYIRSHMPKALIIFVFQVLYGMDCFGTYFTHAQSCDNVRVQSATE